MPDDARQLIQKARGWLALPACDRSCTPATVQRWLRDLCEALDAVLTRENALRGIVAGIMMDANTAVPLPAVDAPIAEIDYALRAVLEALIRERDALLETTHTMATNVGLY